MKKKLRGLEVWLGVEDSSFAAWGDLENISTDGDKSKENEFGE